MGEAVKHRIVSQCVEVVREVLDEYPISHPGAVVVPAALALAEELGATNLDLTEAIVIGYEAMGRAGIAVGPATHMLSGFHPTSMSGVFGSAAAAGRILGFRRGEVEPCFRGGCVFGLGDHGIRFLGEGWPSGYTRGRAAEAGLLAASIVANGFEGATDALAGRYGFCNVFGTAPENRTSDRRARL